jgi:hypothetical protein
MNACSRVAMEAVEGTAMDTTRIRNLEKKVATRVDAIFWRVLWEKDGRFFATNPRKKGTEPMTAREIEELEAEIDADPATSLIVKRVPKPLKNQGNGLINATRE